ncbi:MAG TPA: hypothetical protein VN081_05055 [Dongiaceae bacterium]|nr:hypothetical protein [Dongiaceae bacterium]
MSSRLRQTLMLSLEDEVTPEVPVVETGADSLESELAGVIAADQEVVDSDQAVEDLTDVQATLESLAITVEQSLADGGLTPREAALVEQVYQASAGRVGLKSKVPSMESFGGSSDRERATRVTLEGFKETVQRIWQAIINVLRKWWVSVDKFFFRFFNAATKLASRAQALIKEATDSKGEMNEGAKLKLSGLHSELAGGNAVTAAGELKTVTTDIFDAYAKKMEGFGESCANFLKGVEVSSEEAFKGSLSKLRELKYPVPASTPEKGNASEYGVAGKHEVNVSKPLPGGKVLAVIYPAAVGYEGEAGARDFLNALAACKTVMTTAKGHEEGKEAEHAPLSKENIIAIAKDVHDAALAVAIYQRGRNGVKKVRDALQSAGDEYSKKESKLEGESASLAASLPKLVNAAGKEVDGAQRVLGGYVVSTGAALVQLGEKSIKEHGSKKAAPAAAAAAPAAAAA